MFFVNLEIATCDLLCEGKYAEYMQEKPKTGLPPLPIVLPPLEIIFQPSPLCTNPHSRLAPHEYMQEKPKTGPLPSHHFQSSSHHFQSSSHHVRSCSHHFPLKRSRPKLRTHTRAWLCISTCRRSPRQVRCPHQRSSLKLRPRTRVSFVGHTSKFSRKNTAWKPAHGETVFWSSEVAAEYHARPEKAGGNVFSLMEKGRLKSVSAGKVDDPLACRLSDGVVRVGVLPVRLADRRVLRRACRRPLQPPGKSVDHGSEGFRTC